MRPVIPGMLLLLFGVTVPAFAQEEHHQENAKPAQHEGQANPDAKQEQAEPQKQEQQAKPEKQEQQAKSQEQNQQKQAQQEAKGQQQQEKKHQQQQTKTQQNQEKGQQQQQANGQAQQSQAQYARNGQKDRYGHEYNESHFGPNHHARFEESGGALTGNVGNTLTAAIGSMQEHIRRGFTSGTCTSLWERMGYGMQWHTMTLL